MRNKSPRTSENSTTVSELDDLSRILKVSNRLSAGVSITRLVAATRMNRHRLDRGAMQIRQSSEDEVSVSSAPGGSLAGHCTARRRDADVRLRQRPVHHHDRAALYDLAGAEAPADREPGLAVGHPQSREGRRPRPRLPVRLRSSKNARSGSAHVSQRPATHQQDTKPRSGSSIEVVG